MEITIDNIENILKEKWGKKYLCEHFNEIPFDVIFETFYDANKNNYDKIAEFFESDFILNDPFEYDKQERLQEEIIEMFIEKFNNENVCFNELREYETVICLIERLVKETKFMDLYGDFIYENGENITEGILKVLEPNFLKQNYDKISFDVIFEIIYKEKIFKDTKFIKFMVEKYFNCFIDRKKFFELIEEFEAVQHQLENNLEINLEKIREHQYYNYVISKISEHANEYMNEIIVDECENMQDYILKILNPGYLIEHFHEVKFDEIFDEIYENELYEDKIFLNSICYKFNDRDKKLKSKLLKLKQSFKNKKRYCSKRLVSDLAGFDEVVDYFKMYIDENKKEFSSEISKQSVEEKQTLETEKHQSVLKDNEVVENSNVFESDLTNDTFEGEQLKDVQKDTVIEAKKETVDDSLAEKIIISKFEQKSINEENSIDSDVIRNFEESNLLKLYNDLINQFERTDEQELKNILIPMIQHEFILTLIRNNSHELLHFINNVELKSTKIIPYLIANGIYKINDYCTELEILIKTFDLKPELIFELDLDTKNKFDGKTILKYEHLALKNDGMNIFKMDINYENLVENDFINIMLAIKSDPSVLAEIGEKYNLYNDNLLKYALKIIDEDFNGDPLKKDSIKGYCFEIEKIRLRYENLSNYESEIKKILNFEKI